MSIPGQRFGKASDRTSFVNLLSQYIKEKRSLGDVKAGMNGKLEAKGKKISGAEISRTSALTMDLLTGMENSTESSRPFTASTSNVKSTDFVPQVHSAEASVSKENAASQTDFRGPASVEPRTTSQMTIFYKGQVLVYNDFPGDKAKEILALASQGCSSTGIGSLVDMDKTDASMDIVTPTNTKIPDLNMASASGSKSTEEHAADRPPAIGSDLPIARRNSLHKFLEKRKDRAAARVPYQVNNPRQSPAPKPDESCFSPEEGQSSRQASKDLDLNF